MISKRLTVAFIFLASASAFAWDGWYEKAYNGTNFTADVFRLAESDEPQITLYGGRMQGSYQHEVEQGDLRTFTVDMYDGFVESIPPWGSTSYVTRSFVTDRYHERESEEGDTYYIISNVVYTFTANVARVAVQNQRVQARDVWAIDAIRAIRERKAAVGLDIKNTYDIVFYNRNRDVLGWAKEEIKTLASQFVDPQPSTGFVFSGSFEIGDEHYPKGFDSIQELCQRVGAPDNYFDYTPWVEIGGREKNDTNIYTNAQIPDILPGKTHLDYGWKYIRPMLTNLQMTIGSSLFESDAEYQTRIDCVESVESNPGKVNEVGDIESYSLWASSNRREVDSMECEALASANLEGNGSQFSVSASITISLSTGSWYGDGDGTKPSYWGCRDTVYDDGSTPENEYVAGTDPLWVRIDREKVKYYKPSSSMLPVESTNALFIMENMRPDYVVYERREHEYTGNYDDVNKSYLTDYLGTTGKFVSVGAGVINQCEKYITDEIKCVTPDSEYVLRNSSTNVIFIGSSETHYNSYPTAPSDWTTIPPGGFLQPIILWKRGDIFFQEIPGDAISGIANFRKGITLVVILNWTKNGNAFKYR